MGTQRSLPTSLARPAVALKKLCSTLITKEPLSAVVSRDARYMIEKHTNPTRLLYYARPGFEQYQSFPSSMVWALLKYLTKDQERSITRLSTIKCPNKTAGFISDPYCKGARVDSVVQVGKGQHDSNGYYEFFCLSQSDALIATLSIYPTGEHTANVQWRTLWRVELHT